MKEPVVLVVGVQDAFLEALVVGFEKEGLKVQLAHGANQALSIVRASCPSLVLIGPEYREVPSLDLLQAIRRLSSVPIIMASVVDPSEADVVLALEILEADDYVRLDYRLRELIARIRSALRRSHRREDPPEESFALEVGGVRLDPASHEVEVRGQRVNLPLREFQLLQVLMENAGRVLIRQTLLDRVWGMGYSGNEKTLDIHVKRIRGRIEIDPHKPKLITTFRGLGYKFEKPRSGVG